MPVTISAGQTESVQIIIASPESSLEGDFNLFNIKAEVSNFDYVNNNTRLVIVDKLSIVWNHQNRLIVLSDEYSYADFIDF